MTAISVHHDDARHAQPGHPERPARLAAIRHALAGAGLAGLARVAGEPAPRGALERVHGPAYLDLLETFCERGGGDLDIDTYATPASLDVARQSCGDLLAVVDAVMTRKAANGLALGRPPGHHVRPLVAMGFGLLSNAAVAARHAQAAHGAERVMIVDLDAHHGNGTEEAFADDPSVLFVSSHQADIYPATGALADVGAGAGEGFTVNLPVPAGTGDELAGLYREVLPPLAARFRPDVVLLSLGTDAHRLDPLANLSLSVTGLVEAVSVVHEIAHDAAGGRLVGTLEGGYHVDALAATVVAVLRRLQDPAAEITDPFGPTSRPAHDLAPLAEAVRQLHGL